MLLDGNWVYGLIADVVVGRFILGESLSIINTSGNFSINNNGFTATSGIYSVGINPNSEIINVKVNGANQFYIDTAKEKSWFTRVT